MSTVTTAAAPARKPREITPAGKRALALLAVGPLTRSSEGWVSSDGKFVALNTLAKLRERGLVRISKDKRTAHHNAPKVVA